MFSHANLFKFKISIVTIALCVFSVPASVEATSWAILIGVDDYFQAQDLKYCGADQNALAVRLKQSGFPEKQVFLLHDKATDGRYRPTKRNIEKQLQLVLGLVERGDVVLLSFSGHGLHFGGKSYLCPNDAELDDPNTLINTEAVYDLLKRCPASLKVLLVDACRNDPRPGGQRSLTATNESTALARSFQEATPEGIVLLNSCAPGEISWEEEEFGHGVFMNFVLGGLKGEADGNSDGAVSLAELARYANLNTKVHVARRYNDSQRPFITNESTLDALDFKFSIGSPGAAELITNSIGMKLKLIPAGEFMMGSSISAEEVERQFKAFEADAQSHSGEQPRHRVRITRPFYLGVHEVTVGQFRRFVNSAGYETEPESDSKGAHGWNEFERKFEGPDPKYNWRNSGFVQTDSHPVVNVTWNDAVAFCKWLSRQEEVQYRLPTEAEWEYACRAGTTTLFYNGNDPESLAQVGNVADGTFGAKFSAWKPISARDGYVFTAPSGRFQPNSFGLYDMHGNVNEWCSDWYGVDYYETSPITAPSGPDSGSFRVLRGGSWHSDPDGLRSAFRNRSSPEDRFVFVGFRVVRVVE